MAGDPFKGKDDAKLEQEIAELREELRGFLRENARLREDAHAGLEVSLAHARERFEQIAANARLSWGADPRPHATMVELGGAWAAAQPGFGEALHAAIDAEPGPAGQPAFSPLTRKQFEKEREALRRSIEERAFELERREVSRRKAEAERELASVEERAKAALGSAA